MVRAIFALRMAFLEPGFLWALLALSIPLAIHLFQLRRFKRIDFPNVKLLQEVATRTRSMRRVRHWLVLLARMAALMFLVMAFAQPYMKREGSEAAVGRKAVSIYVDDSYSMDAQNADGRLLDQARRAAQEVIMGHAQTDRFQVLTGRFEGRQQLLMGRDEALEAAAQAEVNAYRRPLSQVIARQRESLSRSDLPNMRSIVLSDLQRSVTDVTNWTNDPDHPTVIVPIQPVEASDLSIDSAWFGSPFRRSDKPEVLHVRITNHGVQDLENIPLQLAVDGKQRAVASFAVGARSQVDTTLRFSHGTSGPHYARVSINDPPIQFDDDLYIAYDVTGKLNVLLIGGTLGEGDRALHAVFSSDSGYSVTQVDVRATDPALLENADLVVVNGPTTIPSGLAQGLTEHVSQGGTLALFPGEEVEISSYNALLAGMGASGFGATDTNRIKVDRIDLDQEFYRDVFSTLPRNMDLPRAGFRYRRTASPGSDVLLRLQNGMPFLTRQWHGEGQVFVGSAPLVVAGGDFIRHALFVTSMLRIAEFSRPSGRLYHVIGEEGSLPWAGSREELKGTPVLRGPDGIEMIPEMRRTVSGVDLSIHGEDIAPGPYAVVVDEDTVGLMALVLSRSEAEQDVVSPEELRELLESNGLSSFEVVDGRPETLSMALVELDTGRKLWKLAILLALLFLAVEVILIRTRS